MEQATTALVGMGLPGIVIAGLGAALWRVHSLYAKSQDCRVSEAIASGERLASAINALDRMVRDK